MFVHYDDCHTGPRFIPPRPEVQSPRWPVNLLVNVKGEVRVKVTNGEGNVEGRTPASNPRRRHRCGPAPPWRCFHCACLGGLHLCSLRHLLTPAPVCVSYTTWKIGDTWITGDYY
jgi:hypothetical protein